MDPSNLKGLRAAVTALKSDASLLHKPDLSFFRDYLVSLGAKMPTASASTGGGGVTEISSVAEWDAACAKGGKAVIDFTASWCPPCKAIKPVYAELAKSYAGRVSFYVVDVDVGKDVATKYEVSAMPTFKFFQNGDVVDELQGASPAELKSKMAALADSVDDGDDGDDPCACCSNDEPKESVRCPGGDEGHEEEENEHGPGYDRGHEKNDEEVVIPPMPVMEEVVGEEADPNVIPEAERDEPPYPEIGDVGAELSEVEMEKMMEAKMAASKAASSGDYAAALEKWNTVIQAKPSPLTLAKRADVLLKLRRPNAAIADCDAALKMNPDSAKSLKTRGKAYRLIGEWEKANSDLGQGNGIDFDEESAEVQKVVQAHASVIRERKNKHAAAMRAWTTEKETIERTAARKKAQREYNAQKQQEMPEMPSGMGGMPGGMGGMPGGMGGMPGGMGGMPGGGGMPGMGGADPLANLSPEMKAKLTDPAVQAKLSGIFGGMQTGDPAAAMGEAMKHMGDPEVGPIITAILGGMMGGGGGGMPGMPGMPGMGGMGGMGDFGDDDLPDLEENPKQATVEEVD